MDIITNASRQTLDLGAHAITIDNAHASKPFGTIDTPVKPVRRQATHM